MAKPLAVICADLQAREYAYRKNKELFGDDLVALAESVDLAIRTGVEYFIIAGDIVDTPAISDSHVIKMRKILRKLDEYHIMALFIHGNHERGRFQRLVMEGEGAEVGTYIDGQLITLTDEGLTLRGYDWRRRKDWETLIASNGLEGADVLVTHGLADQVIPFLGVKFEEDFKPIGDFDLDWFMGKYKLALLGDYHHKWVYKGPDTTFVYPGSMWQHRVGEDPDKYVIILNDDLTFSENRLQLQRPFTSVELYSEEDLEQLVEAVEIMSDNSLPEIIRKPRVHVSIRFQSEAIRPTLEKLAQQAIVFDRTKLQASENPSMSDEDDQPSRVDLNGIIEQFVNEEEPELRSFLHNIIGVGTEEALKRLQNDCGVN
jgi:DNA repair exonuclease SbcCD nuclease subunit